MIRLLFVLVLVVVCAGCKKEDDSHFEEIDKSRSSKDVLVPLELKKELFGESGSAAGEPVAFQVRMTQLMGQPLGGRKILLNFNSGGGELDLAEFVKEKSKGTYQLKFEFEPPEKSELKIWFLSHAPKRSIGDELVGNGCGVSIDITTSFEKQMSKGGFQINTTERRDLSAIGGVFFLVFKTDTQLRVSHLKVYDSRMRLCDNIL